MPEVGGETSSCTSLHTVPEDFSPFLEPAKEGGGGLDKPCHHREGGVGPPLEGGVGPPTYHLVGTLPLGFPRIPGWVDGWMGVRALCRYVNDICPQRYLLCCCNVRVLKGSSWKTPRPKKSCWLSLSRPTLLNQLNCRRNSAARTRCPVAWSPVHSSESC